MDARIYPHEVILSSLIVSLVEEGRGARHLLGSNAMNLVCIINDNVGNIALAKPRFVEVNLLLEKLNNSFSQDSKFANDFLNRIRFASIDNLIDHIENFEIVFEATGSLSPNGIVAPNRLSRDSPLGLYIRYFLAQWDSLSYESICDLFDRLTSALEPNNDSSIDYSNNDLNEIPSQYTSLSLWDDVECDLLQADMLTGEAATHQFFDFAGYQNSMLIPLYGGTEASTTSSSSATPFSTHLIARTSDSLLSLESSGCLSTQARHQLSMLALAVNWERHGNYNLALTAMEEATKTAHQRGDHVTVAKCLLVLFQILRSSQRNGGDSQPNAAIDEELLSKCLDRAAECKLPLLSAQAAIALAQVRCKGLKPGASISSQVDADSPGPSLVLTAEIWSLLSVCQIGLPKITALVARGAYNPQLQGLATTNPLVPPSANGAARASAASFTCSELDSLQPSIALTSADIWNQLGLTYMAGLECRRLLVLLLGNPTAAANTMRLMSAKLYEELTAVVCKLARSIVDEQNSDQPKESSCIRLMEVDGAPASNHEQLMRACNQALTVLQAFTHFAAQLNPAITESKLEARNSVEQTKLQVLVRLAMIQGHTDRALRLTLRLEEMLKSNRPATAKPATWQDEPDVNVQLLLKQLRDML